jgi:GTP cyclohydrolase I
VRDKSGGVQHTIATFNMYVGLPHNFKGTHMSRFVEILNSHEREISVESFEPMLREMVKRWRPRPATSR